MGINVAGTNALGDYLVSEIQNTRTLMGDSPAPAAPAPTASSAASPTHAQLQQQLADAQLANTQTLFGVQQTAQTALTSADDGSLPPIAGQTPQQIRTAGIQESLIAQQFANTATLFNSLGFGANVNALA